MSALDNMKIRLDYYGGSKQQSRMIKDKLRSLKKSLLYSYQAGTMIIQDENAKELKFRCLMNPDKRTFDADKMMLSVPFEDICLNQPIVGKTTEGYVKVPIKCGSTFIWEETETRWLVTLQYLEELAYFRADVRKCYSLPIEINGKEYWFALTGENEKTTEWLKHNKEEWNKLNYTRELFIERNEETFNYFKRFKIIKLPNVLGEYESWEVQAVRPNSTSDILIVYVKEYFENRYEEISNEEQYKIQEEHELNEDLVCFVYDDIIYSTRFIENAMWGIINKTEGLNLKITDAVINEDKINTTVFIQLLNGKTGEFDITYNDKVVKHVVVKSF